VIGSGPGGERSAATAAFFGKRVALVEKSSVLGGASTNTGTVPSKTFRETALALSGLRARNLYGVDLSLRRDATIRDFMYHEESVKSSERDRVRSSLDRTEVTRYNGVASFVDPHTLSVSGGTSGDLRLSAEQIIIATGSSPVHPPTFCFEDERVLDSDEILTMERLPKSLAVIGAGVIGSEYACIFAAMGTEVHLLDGRDTLLPFLDREIAAVLEQAMKGLGVTLHWNEKVTSCDVSQPGPVRLSCESGNVFALDAVLVAAGRKSNVELLNLTAAGIRPGDRGLLKVDNAYRTEVPHIYAVGDVIGFPALAATSAEQGRIAACHAAGKLFKKDISPLLPTGIYTIPEISMIGETEESLKKQEVPFIVGRAHYEDNARGKIIGETSGLLKLLFHAETQKLLGVHVIGEQATELVHIGLMAMLAGADREIFNSACFNYPTLGDLYKAATYDAFISTIRPDLAKASKLGPAEV
jgi:NAD(P) transhydrogenase